MDPQALFDTVLSQGYAAPEQKDDYNTWIAKGGFPAKAQVPTPDGSTVEVTVLRLNLASFKALFEHEGLSWRASFTYEFGHDETAGATAVPGEPCSDCEEARQEFARAFQKWRDSRDG